MWLASGALALLVGAAFAALILAVSAQREATDREARSKDVTTESLQLEKLVSDIESSFLNFAVTNKRSSLTGYRDTRPKLDPQLADFNRLVRDDPEQSSRALGIENQIREYVFFWLDSIIQVLREEPGIAQDDSSLVQENKNYTDEIRRLFVGFRGAENALAAQASRDADRRTDLAVVVGGIAVGASMALIALFGIVLARSIGRPVRAVADGAGLIAAGNFSYRLPEGGPGEVGELTHAFNEMAERLEVSHAELEQQNEELRESERMKTELVSIVSHELRTPLASVLGFTALLLKREFDPATRRHYLGIVDAQARRLAALLEEQAQLYAAQSPKHQLEVEAERPLPVRGDPGRFAQVVGNLLSNAIKYSPEGGTVEVVAGRSAEGVRIAVRDEGLGIPEEQQDRIFTKFFRGDAAATGITGTGLGLAVSREIVEAHGGRIGFDSDPGQGTTFWLELPGANGESRATHTKEERE